MRCLSHPVAVVRAPIPFDNPADSNTATTDETSNNNTGTTDNTDGSGNTDTSENTVTSISFGGATPPDGNSVVNVTSENNSIIRTLVVLGMFVTPSKMVTKFFISTISGLMATQVIRTQKSPTLMVLVRKTYMPHLSQLLTRKMAKQLIKMALMLFWHLRIWRNGLRRRTPCLHRSRNFEGLQVSA